jgi:poly(3-hydroxybutyrate) depolymerase
VSETSDLQELVAHPGANSLSWHDREFPDQTLYLHAARPRRYTPRTPLLFVHHGVGRNGEAYRDYWLPLAEENDLLAIAIEFPEESFPDYLRYHFGNLHNEDGTPNPREKWTYGIVPRLFDALRDAGVTSRERYGMFGHSAGGQFVHRMLSFGFRDRVAVAVSANAGTYAMPDLDVAWPFGLGQTEVTPDTLTALVNFPITVMAGMNDTKTTGRYLSQRPAIDASGRDTVAPRAQLCSPRAGSGGGDGHAVQWTVIDVPGVGHDGHGMSIAAAPVVAAALARIRTLPPTGDRG